MSEPKFDELSIEKQRNEILKAIHNRLSEISISLEYLTRFSSFINDDEDDFYKFQRKWTRYIERCKGLYIDEKRKETQKGETD